MQKVDPEKEKMKGSRVMRRWINFVLIVFVIFMSAGVGYYWCYRVSVDQLSMMLNKVQANSAFNRIIDDGHIVDMMKRNCYEGALKRIEWNVQDQKRMLSDLVQDGVGPDFVKYVEDRAPGLLASATTQSYTTQRGIDQQCPGTN